VCAHVPFGLLLLGGGWDGEEDAKAQLFELGPALWVPPPDGGVVAVAGELWSLGRVWREDCLAAGPVLCAELPGLSRRPADTLGFLWCPPADVTAAAAAAAEAAAGPREVVPVARVRCPGTVAQGRLLWRHMPRDGT
jgi:hypothetical protein